MANVFNLEAREVAGQIAKVTGEKSRAIARSLPLEAIGCYGAIALSVVMWGAAINKKLPPQLSLAATAVGAGIVAVSASRLDDLQDTQDEKKEDKELFRALRQEQLTSVQVTRHYAESAQERLRLADALPEHMRETDLLPPSQQPQTGSGDPFTDFEAFEASAMKQRKDAGLLSAGEPVDAIAAPDDASQQQPGYAYGTRTNPQTKQPETTVDLAGHDTYAGLPIVDLAALMAQDSRGCLGIGSTGCGKTELQKQAIAAQYRQDETTDFTIFAHKSANTAAGETLDYAGLENSKDCYIFTASQSGHVLAQAASAFETRIKVLDGLIENGSAVPSVVAIDQANQGVVAAEKAHRESKREYEELKQGLSEGESQPDLPSYKYLAEDYQNFIQTGLVDGREKRVKLWSFGHANTNKGTGVDHQIKQNVFFVGLGRAGNYQAVENPLDDSRFIKSKSERDALRSQLDSYLNQHRLNGSPVNVVCAISNCGHEGWRLIVLPQYKPANPIVLGVTNPPVDDFAQPEEEAIAPPPAIAESQKDYDQMRAKLDSSFDRGISYSSDQVATATAFVRWVKINAHDYVDSRGFVDPYAVWGAFEGVRSPEEMEMILSIVEQQGGGEFITDNLTGNQKFKLKRRQPNETSAPVATTPNGITREILQDFLTYLATKQPGTLHEPKSFLDGDRTLKRKHRLTVAQVRSLLQFLEQRHDVIKFVGNGDSQFQFLGFDDAI